jgi:hypothetical protein
MVGGLVDRRQCERELALDRRRSIPGHEVRVGTLRDRPGWLIGLCSCGGHAEARVEVDGVVEAWVTAHRFEVGGRLA